MYVCSFVARFTMLKSFQSLRATPIEVDFKIISEELIAIVAHNIV